jgi:tRNA(adenine34) deaminase
MVPDAGLRIPDSGLRDEASRAMNTTHEQFIQEALEQARLGAASGEVPVGAVLVVDGVVVARAFNQPIGRTDPTAHAEILVLRDAAAAIGNYRLVNGTLYVTIEPCLMCVGALVHARVREVVFGAPEPRTGALVSAVQGLDLPGLNHRFEVTPGVCADECRELMQAFFRDRRRLAD